VSFNADNKCLKYAPLAMVFGGILISFLSAWYVWTTNRTVSKARLSAEALQVERFTGSRLETYVNALVHAKALFSTADHIDRETFHRYVNELRIFEKYPGTSGIGYIRKLKNTDLRSHLAELHREGFPEYKVWPLGREVYFPIVYYEPLNEVNRRLMGYDTSAEATRRAAQDQAAETGSPAISPKIALVRDAHLGKIPGFVMYAPIYRHGAEVETVEQRKQALAGFVHSTFRATTFFEALLKQNPVSSPIAFDVFDGDSTAPEDLLYSFRSNIQGTSFLTETRQIVFGGRAWTLRFRTLPGFVSNLTRLGPLIVFMGSLIVILSLAALISAVQAREQAERKLNEEVRKALQVRDEFMSIASHELKTPLTSLKLQLDMAKQYANRDPVKAIQQMINVGSRQVSRLTNLIDELLDVTRIESGKMIFRFEQIDLAQMADELVQRYRNSFRNSGCEIALVAPKPVIVEGDSFRLEQVLINLLTNSMKYGNSRPIELKVEEKDGNAVVSVKDQGIGIPENKLSLIFQRFERVSDTAKESGLGLGLYITRKIVDAHQGHIDVESEVGKGSVFTVTLPSQQTAPS
jgi:signal transduction histidine kinase